MANLRQKPPDVRRQRYINAVEPFRKKYDCTAAQVFGVIQGIEQQNSGLKNQVSKLEEKLVQEINEGKAKNAEIDALKSKVAELEENYRLISIEAEALHQEVELYRSNP